MVREPVKLRFELSKLNQVALGGNLFPDVVGLDLFESATSQRAHRCLEALLGDVHLGCAEGQEELEDGLTVGKHVLQGVFQLNQKLVVPDKLFECILPVVDVDETFLVRIKLRKEPLQQWHGQVESLQAILRLNERFEHFKWNLARTLACLIKAFVKAAKGLGQSQAHLLDGVKLPVKGADVLEAS